MRSSNTFGIQFVIRLPKQQKNDQATVFARISVNGRRFEISLKKKVSPQNWDDAKGKARGTKDEIRKLNEHIERIRTLIADGYHELIQQKKVVTVDAVKSLFLGADENEVTLIKLGDYHNTEMKDKLADGTIESVSKMLGHTTIRSTQVYAKVVEQKLSEDMQNLKKRMANQ